MKTRGFTLMELMVAVFISGIVLTSVMTSYAALLRNKQKIDHFRHTQSTATLTLARIADKVRDYGIYYDAYPSADATGETEILHLGPYLNADGEPETMQFRFENNTVTMTANGQTAPLSGRNVNVQGSFIVSPTAIPNTGEGPQLYQPRVQIALDVSSAIDPEVTLSVQTTISSRQYQ